MSLSVETLRFFGRNPVGYQGGLAGMAMISRNAADH